MAGVVLETLSNRKLAIFGVIILLAQLLCFLLGALIAPRPFNVESVLSTICIDEGKHMHKSSFFYSRGEGKCSKINDLQDPDVEKKGITANQVVFAFQFPLPRDDIIRDMSRYFQFIVSVLNIEIVYDKDIPFENGAMLTMDARLGYRNKGENDSTWHEIARSTEERSLNCEILKEEKGYPLDCDMLAFFELGSCHHDFYLLNIRLPVAELKEINMNIGSVKEFTLTTIHQNGGFTKVWLSMKTILFPLVFAALVWFWHRIAQLDRQPMLLEKTLFALGLALSFLNVPLEWLTLWFNMPFMMLLGDIRQGIFYAVLLSFWIIFAGEHLMDQIERNRFVLYWKHLTAVLFGCICLFVFELCERGVQLSNPFYSIWTTETSKNIALTFIILAGIAASLYFIFLCYMIFKVFRNISAKKLSLPSMNKARRNYYLGLMYRFKCLMLGTLFCAAMTVIFYIISQVGEGEWKWDSDSNVEYTSGFFTGVYGMWNLYVLSLLFLYSPSGKYLSVLDNDTSADDDVVEFSNLPSEAISLTALMKKPTVD